MKLNNSRWGARRIVGELLKLGKLKRIYVFSLMDTSARKIIAVPVAKNPNTQWLEGVIRNTFIKWDVFLKYLVSDRDGVYGEWFGKFFKDCYDLTLYRAPPRTPNCNAFIERWIRSVREELLDRSNHFR
jgi:putative transposase